MAIEVVEKAFAVVEVMARLGKPASLAELTHEARLPKPTLHRILQTLCDLGYVESTEPRGSYGLTQRLIALGKTDRYRGLRQAAQPLLQRLHRRFNETVNLGLLEGLFVYYVDVLETSQPLRWIVKPGARDMFHTTALGRAVAAFLPVERRAVLVRKTDLKHPANKPVKNRQELERILERVRLNGWAWEEEETVAGVACFAFPLARWGEPNASISVSVPVSRLTPRLRREIERAFEEILREVPEDWKRLVAAS